MIGAIAPKPNTIHQERHTFPHNFNNRELQKTPRKFSPLN